ncbi:MAG: hypothetical protein IJ789_02325 [Bacteroidales bacterium]|nr:hypothetical protein [Bacteroidales bacterium]
MITMMYLVYTAMLALNVSAEVVNGFKTVGNAMNKSNENIAVKLDDTYANFAKALENSRDKVQDKYDKAQEVKRLSTELGAYIDSVEYTFVGMLASKAKITPNPEDPKEVRIIEFKNDDGTTNLDSVKEAMRIGGFSWIETLDNNHKGTRFFLGDAEGDNPTSGAAIELKAKIMEYKQRVKEILGDDSVHVALGLDVERVELNSEKKPTSWEMLNFNNTVAGAALVTLTRMKAETMNAEFDVVNMLYKQISAGDFKFDQVSMISRPKSTYIIQGGTYETDINVAAYDSHQQFSATINGQTRTSNDSGSVHYSVVCNTLGPQTITGTAYVTNPDGGVKEYPIKDSYFVAKPLAVVSLDNMQVLYAGIANPVTISVPGVDSRSLKPTIVEGKATIAPNPDGGGPEKYIITPTAGSRKIVINIDGTINGKTSSLGKYEAKVKEIPEPTINVGGYENGARVSRSDFSDGTRVIAMKQKGFEFTLPKNSMRVTHLSISVNGRTEEKNGDVMDAQIVSVIKKANRGDKIFITATVMMPDGKPKEAYAVYTIKK